MLYTLIPMLVILVLTLWAMVENLAGFLSGKEYLLAVISSLILLLTAWLTLSGMAALWKKISQSDGISRPG